MFARWIFELFIGQHDKRAGNPPPCVTRHYNVIEIAPSSSDKWISKFFPIFISLGGELIWIGSRITENDSRRAFRPHHGNLARG